MSTLMHERISAKQRATVISMQSLSMQVFGALGVVSFAWVAAQTQLGWAFTLSGIVIMGAGLLMRTIAKIRAISQQCPENRADHATR
jgi:hypothetical protein